MHNSSNYDEKRLKYMQQHTLKSKIEISGVGLHSGQMVDLVLYPADAGTGVVFVRTDIQPKEHQSISARWDNVVDTQLCSVIANEHGARVGTIEHLMSALCGCGVDNVIIEIDGPEVPIMDGSAMVFVEHIEAAGLIEQSKIRRAIRVLRDVSVEHEGNTVTLKPADEQVFAGEIKFDHPVIGTQRFETQLVNGNFKHDIAAARTFGFLHEVDWMRSQGLAQGGSLENAIVLDSDGVMNPEGLRSEDEFIRHKILDAIGDLYLAGGPLLGAYDGFKASHALNNKVLRALFADDSAWEFVHTN